MAKPAHLTDLFRSGRLVDVTVMDPNDPTEDLTFQVYMRKPSPTQQDEAMAKARAKQARRKALYADPESDMYVAKWSDVGDIEERDELIEFLVKQKLTQFRSQAYNEVLFADPPEGEEPKWGEHGRDYLDLEQAIYDRRQELAKLDDADALEDEELKRLVDLQDEFQEEVQALVEQLMAGERITYEDMPEEELRKKVFKQFIEMETGLEWWQEYKMWMLFYATRYPDDHKRLYFNDIDDVYELPSNVSSKLMNSLDQIDRSLAFGDLAGDSKN